MKKHNKIEHWFKCKQCPKTFKEKITLNMHKNTSHQEKNVETRKSLTPTSGALSLDTAPPASQGTAKLVYSIFCYVNYIIRRQLVGFTQLLDVVASSTC